MPGPPIYEDWWTGDWWSFEELPHPCTKGMAAAEWRESMDGPQPSVRQSGSELMGSLKLGNVWVFVQLIQMLMKTPILMKTKNNLYKHYLT